MNFANRLNCLLLSVCLWLPTFIIAQEQPVVDPREQCLQAAEKLLKEWGQVGALPEGVVLRVDAHLFGPNDICKDQDKAVKNKPVEEKKFEEHWEFTAKHVHRVSMEYRDDKWVRTTVESKPFESKQVCETLIASKATEIAARKGTGECKLFVGTGYHLGGRSLEVIQGDQELLELYEHCTGAGFPETDAVAFAKLYETLASYARDTLAPAVKH